MRNQILPLLALFSLALNVAFVGVWAVLVFEAPRAADRDEEGHTIWSPLHCELGVTPEQWRQLEPEVRTYHERAQTIREDLGVLRSELIELIAAENPELDAINAKHEEIRARQKQMQELVTGHLLTKKEILTSGQEQELFDMMLERTYPRPGRVIRLGEPGADNAEQ